MPQVHGATPPVMSSEAVSPIKSALYPMLARVFCMRLIAVDFPAHGPPVMTILIISMILYLLEKNFDIIIQKNSCKINKNSL